MWRKENAEEDRGLVRRCQSGDDAAFEELVRKYQLTLFNVIHHNIGRRGDIEDVAQKIFSKIYFALHKFDPDRPFFPWIYRITVNQCYDELRRFRRRRAITFCELNLEETENIENLLRREEANEASPEDRRKRHDLLYKMLDRLPEKQRRALILRDLEEVPYDEMARLMQCTEQAARLKVFRARNRLRDLVTRAMRRRERGTNRRQNPI